METKNQKFDISYTVNIETRCWEWKRSIGTHGYGVFSRVSLAHRFSYERFKGKIPKGLQIDHLCRNKKCVNPDHLEAVTGKINSLRGDRAKIQRSKTHCLKGHEYTEENTYRYPDGRRSCEVCRKIARKDNKNKKGKIKMSDRTHCPYGHEYIESNVYLSSKGQRFCIQCRRNSSKKYYHEKIKVCNK